MANELYSVTSHSISNLLGWIDSGSIAIPEIQRPFVWNSTQVRDLLDSLYRGFPVGYIITWQNPNVRLKDGSSVGDNFTFSRSWRAKSLDEHLQDRHELLGFPPEGIHEMLSTVPHQTDRSPTMLQNGNGPGLAEPDPQAQTEHPGQCHQSEESL